MNQSGRIRKIKFLSGYNNVPSSESLHHRRILVDMGKDQKDHE
jgi:hypothetical protein